MTRTFWAGWDAIRGFSKRIGNGHRSHHGVIVKSLRTETKTGPCRPLKILHFMPTNFGMTGVETFILQLAAAQRRLGMQPVIAMELANRDEVQSICNASSLHVHDLPSRGGIEGLLPRTLGTILLRVRRTYLLARILWSSDVLHIHAVGLTGLEGFVAALCSRIRATVVTHHGSLTWFAPQRRAYSEISLWLERTCDSSVVLPLEDWLPEYIGAGIKRANLSIIPFCFDETRFKEDGREGRTPVPGRLTLIMTARMYPGKGHLELLSALAKLLPRYPELRAILIGDGPIRGMIEDEINRLGLRHAVSCYGRVNHWELPNRLREGHVTVLPSYLPGEILPLGLMEAMAMGLPGIGTRWSGIPQIVIDGQTGLLVPPHDVAGLVQAIERYLLDPKFYARASTEAVMHVRDRFTATGIAKAYQRLYLQALDH